MNQFKNLIFCRFCDFRFSNDFVPKILPCYSLMCSECIRSKTIVLSEFQIDCVCRRTHLIPVDTQLPTSEICLQMSKLIPADYSFDPLNQRYSRNGLSIIIPINSDPFYAFLRDKVTSDWRSVKCDIESRYDMAVNDIDIRAETLINRINSARTELHMQLREQRDKTLTFFDHFDSVLTTSNDEFDFDNKAMFDFFMAVQHIKCDLKSAELENANLTSMRHEMVVSMANACNFISNFLFAKKRDALYFDANSSSFDNSMLGANLSVNTDSSFLKLKNYATLHKDPSRSKTIHLESTFRDLCLRQIVLPLSIFKIVKIYFTSKQALHLEQFDGEGRLHKSVRVFENVSCFPVYHYFDGRFVVCFSAKNSADRNPTDKEICYARLYSADLDLIGEIQSSWLIDSVCMSKREIILFFSHLSNSCCASYTPDLKQRTRSFGQQTNADAPFYFEKSVLKWKDQMQHRFKLNPVIFSMGNSTIYFYNHNYLYEMDSTDGSVLAKQAIRIGAEAPYFLMDSQSNILQVNTVSKRVQLINLESKIRMELFYDHEYSDVYISKENYLAFIADDKATVQFI